MAGTSSLKTTSRLLVEIRTLALIGDLPGTGDQVVERGIAP